MFYKHRHLQGSANPGREPSGTRGGRLCPHYCSRAESSGDTEHISAESTIRRVASSPHSKPRSAPTVRQLPYPQPHQARQSSTPRWKCACTEKLSAFPPTGFPSKSEFLFPAAESLSCFLLPRPMSVTRRTGWNRPPSRSTRPPYFWKA